MAIINKSLVESKVSLSFKKANIRQLLKKPNLDKEELKVHHVIYHKILQKRLEHSFGVTGSALSWIRSYLSDIFQCVAIGMMTPEGKGLNVGVPQGSILGPLTYCLYSKPIWCDI